MSSQNPWLFQSERLGWRWWRADDLPLALALWGDGRVMQHLHVNGVLTPDEVRARLDLEISLQREHGYQYWPMFERSTGKHVGCAGVRPKDLAHGRLETGFHLRPEFWRLGLASEAAARVVRHAFEEIEVDELFAGHHPALVASRRILTRLGFRYDRDELYPATQAMHPTYLLRPERWRRQQEERDAG